MKKTWSLMTLLSLAASLTALADASSGANPPTGKDQATACMACHGPRGISTNPLWPHLAGQSEAYLVGQLKAFKEGSRFDPLMRAQVANLSEQDIKDIAAYFSALTAPVGVASPEPAGVGEAVYLAGNAQSGVPACKDCHGPAGVGNVAAAYVRLAGQQADYVALQLRIYRDGQRKVTPEAQMMSVMAARLTDAEIAAVASYLSGLH